MSTTETPTVPLILREPVRLYLYGLTVPVVALLVGLGLVNGSTATLIGAVAAALFSVPVTEATRLAVVSPATAAAVSYRTGLRALGAQHGEDLTDTEVRDAKVAAVAELQALNVPSPLTTVPLAA